MNSLWRSTCKMPRFPRLEKDVNTDVLIIGGGLVGLLTAHELHKRGIKYILVEKGRICGGTTQNTSAKITVQHGFVYQDLLKNNGVDAAKMYLQANTAAFDRLEELCRKIDCDYEKKDNYVYSVSSRDKTEKEFEALRKIGGNAEFCEPSELVLPIMTCGAVKYKNQAQFHPLKFAAEIAKDLNICENTFVREITNGIYGKGNTAVTDRAKINAKMIIVATHFPFINKHGSYFLKLYQHRSYVVALENKEKSLDVGGMYVDESGEGLSFRNYNDLLLLGGGAHRTGKEGGNWRVLKHFARTHYPQSEVKYLWAAQDCMSLDKLPYVGRYSKNTPTMYAASGFNKWGMTGAMLAAMMLCDFADGVKNEYAELYNPSRSILKPQLFINGFETAKNLLTFSEKRCPHLGCALKWNKAEHSWDCACHGSRFDEKGKVLDNPANGNLN